MADCGCARCCSFPNGGKAIAAMVMAIISYALALAAVYGCHYMEIGGEVGLGLYTIEELFDFDDDGNWCREWSTALNDNVVDGAWKAARAFGSISTACGFIVMVATFCMACMSFSKGCLKVFGLLAAFGGLSVSLTFIAFSSDVRDAFTLNGRSTELEFGASAGVAIGAIICYWITAFLISTCPEAPDDQPPPTMAPVQATASPEPAPGTTTTQVITNPDGTTKTIKTTINADGSKTIEETETKMARQASGGLRASSTAK